MVHVQALGGTSRRLEKRLQGSLQRMATKRAIMLQNNLILEGITVARFASSHLKFHISVTQTFTPTAQHNGFRFIDW